MDAQELCKRFNVSESSLKNQFKRTAESILRKYGVQIEKRGRGKNTTYEEVTVEDQRALTIFDEQKSIVLAKDSVKLMNWELLVLIAVIATPMLVFRGSYKDFILYTGLKPTESAVAALKEALMKLEEKGYILYKSDLSTNEEYFVASLYRAMEKEMNVEISMIKRCQWIAQKHNKKSWLPLLKVWVGMKIASEEQPFTNGKLAEITGMSIPAIVENKKMLEEDEVFRTKRAYLDYQTCIGQVVDLNGFYSS